MIRQTIAKIFGLHTAEELKAAYRAGKQSTELRLHYAAKLRKTTQRK